MKAGIQTLEKLFLPHIQHQIPTFQRPYVWTEKDQWRPLWEDVRNTAQRDLDKRREAGPGNDTITLKHPHFLGAIVIQQQASTGGIGKRDIIDGQQRLTTLQLLLDATQEVFAEINPEAAQGLSELILNDSRLIEAQEDLMFKVWPTLSDREAFRHVMRRDQIKHADQKRKIQDKKIAKAHNFFKSRVREWVTAEPDAVLALESTLRNHLQLVVIDLKRDDDPYVIFEVLNARGTPLLEADLIKNFILSEANKEGLDANKLQTTHWGKMEEEWWREAVGRPARPRIEVFLNHWIVMHLAKEVQPSDVYSKFRTYADKFRTHEDGHSVADIAKDIGALSSVYRRLQKAKDDPALGRVIHQWRGSLAPTLMWLLSSGVPDPQLGRCLRIIESFLARRMIRKMTTANYNQLFLLLLEQLKENPIEQADVVIVEFLAEQKAWGRLWPDDRDLEQVFAESPLYERLGQWQVRLVLERIEEQLRGPLTEEQRVPPNLTIEHAMPQKWRAHWVPPTPTDIPGEAEQQRDRLVHTIGNLTLVTQKLNPTLSNAAWREKRTKLNAYSVLELRKSLTIHDEWSEETIRARGHQLAKVAARVWPHADAWRKRLEA